MNNNEQQMTIFPLKEGQVVNELTLEPEQGDPAFIESNTQSISEEELLSKNVIPTFCDGTLTLGHGQIIEATMKAAEEVFGELSPVKIRVSHRIQGRTPDAINKPASELTEGDITTFWQRMAFISRLQGFTRIVNGVEVHLCIGGTRSYSEDKLFGRPTPSKMRLFVGWFVRLCSNGCLTCDGNSGTIECMTEADVKAKALSLFRSFDPEKENALAMLENLGTTRISEEQLCHVIGRLRLYQALPLTEQSVLPKFLLGDTAINKVAQGYISNPNFGRRDEDSITLWSLLNLMNEAVKQGAYINDWAERNQNATDFVLGLQKALQGQDEEGYDWFLN